MPVFTSDSYSHFSQRPLLFVDLEMSGLDPQAHEIIEVAALVVPPSDFKIANSYYTKVLPEHIETADPKALEINHYSPKDWKEAISLRQMLQELSVLSGFCILSGWNVEMEWNFLIAALEKENLPYFFDQKLFDVWTLAYLKYYQRADLKKLKLATVSQDLGISIDNHKPDSDIRATYEIFKKLTGL
jgi:DNA polymerase-3 subunit epsilon